MPSFRIGGDEVIVKLHSHVGLFSFQRRTFVNHVMLQYYRQVRLQCCCIQVFYRCVAFDSNSSLSFLLHTCVSDMAKPFNVVVFHCRHMFHKECLPSSGTVSNLCHSLHNISHYVFHLVFSFRHYSILSEDVKHDLAPPEPLLSFLSQIPVVQFCNICSAKKRGPGSGILEMKK